MSFENQTFFWAVAAKGLQQSLLYMPAIDAQPEEALLLSFHDCDGAVVNKAEILFPSARNCLFELEPLMGLLKLESGMRHGLVMLQSQSNGRVVSRYHSGQSVTLVPASQTIANLRQGLVPVNNQGRRETYLALTNCDDVTVEIKAKLLIGKRSPEVSWELPPFASRIINLNSAFTDAIGVEAGQISGRGYVRLSTSAIAGVLVHSLVYDQREDGSEMVQIL